MIRERLQDSIRVKQLMLENEATQAAISKLSNEIIGTIKRGRSEERRVGKESDRECRSRWSPYP